MKFFQYRQNNPGGRFREDPDMGIGEYVIIEAPNAITANALAIGKGIYFEGASNGMDCNCCGDRWWPAREDEGTDEPRIYESVVLGTITGSLNGEPNVFVHYLDGKILATGWHY